MTNPEINNPNKSLKTFKKHLNKIAKEKGLTTQELQEFLTKLVLVEAGQPMNPLQKQFKGGPGRGLAQWETNEGEGSNRVVTSLERTRNYFNYINEPLPESISTAIKEMKKAGTYDMTSLPKYDQLMVLLSDLRMGNGDLKILKEENGDFEMWKEYWWQGDDDEIPKKQKLWNERKELFEKNKDTFLSKLYETSLDDNNLINSNEISNDYSTPPFSNDIEGNKNLEQNYFNNRKGLETSHLNLTKKSIKDYLVGNNISKPKEKLNLQSNDFLNNKKIINERLNTTKELVSDRLNQKSLGGLTNSINLGNKNLNSFNTGGLHEQNPLGGIPIGIGSNGKINTVEKGETSFETKNGKFIFSNRIKIE